MEKRENNETKEKKKHTWYTKGGGNEKYWYTLVRYYSSSRTILSEKGMAVIPFKLRDKNGTTHIYTWYGTVS